MNKQVNGHTVSKPLKSGAGCEDRTHGLLITKDSREAGASRWPRISFEPYWRCLNLPPLAYSGVDIAGNPRRFATSDAGTESREG